LTISSSAFALLTPDEVLPFGQNRAAFRRRSPRRRFLFIKNVTIFPRKEKYVGVYFYQLFMEKVAIWQ